METAILVIGACNLLVGFFLFITLLYIARLFIGKDERTKPSKRQNKTEVSESEKQRIEFAAKRKAEQWGNFFSYTGESQKRGGD